MIDYNNNDILIRLAGRCWIICLLVCGLVGCTDEVIINQSQQTEYATLVLNIKTPASSVPKTATRSAQTAEETNVKRIKVLVFNDSNGDGTYLFNYMAEGTQLENLQDMTSRFQVLLHSSTVPIKICLVANYADAFENYTPPFGADEATVKTSICRSFDSAGMTEFLPMYGEIAVPRLDAATINVFSVTVLRAIARVDAKTQLAPNSPRFSLRELYVFRANDQIQIIPNGMDASGSIRVSSPSVPEESTPLASPVMKSSSVATDSIGGLYIPESHGVESSGEERLAATTVVVGGVFGNETKISYYRVDFNSGIKGHPFGQVLRNYLYTFIIKKVNASGFSTAEEAARNLASSMTVEVQQWEDFTTEMYFHDNYIGVSTRQVTLPYLPDFVKTVDVESSMNYEILWLDHPELGSVSEAGVPLSTGDFTATIERNDGESPYLSHIRIDSPTFNTGEPIQTTLRIIANGTAVDINVTKDSSAHLPQTNIRILSMGTGFGSLGSFNAPVAVTLPMRKILENSFTSGSYPLKVGGFFFLTVPISDPNFSNATDPASLAVFKRLISDFDVLMMTYQNIVSKEVADMLLNEWLVEDTHRVLWIMRDSEDTNANLLALTAQEGYGVWENVGKAFDAQAGYRYSNEADYAYNNAEEVKEFFNGPFGTINNEPGQQILRTGDIVSGACNIGEDAKKYVTPLVYSNKPGYEGYMTLGVNKDKGIVFQGESQFFQYNVGMSYDAYINGAITTTPDTTGKYYYDLLMANIWAWVAGRVLYGTDTAS